MGLTGPERSPKQLARRALRLAVLHSYSYCILDTRCAPPRPNLGEGGCRLPCRVCRPRCPRLPVYLRSSTATITAHKCPPYQRSSIFTRSRGLHGVSGVGAHVTAHNVTAHHVTAHHVPHQPAVTSTQRRGPGLRCPEGRMAARGRRVAVASTNSCSRSVSRHRRRPPPLLSHRRD